MASSKRKKLLILTFSLLFAILFSTLYNITAVHWEATGLSIVKNEEYIPELTIEITEDDLVSYPRVATALNTVNENGETFLSREDQDIILEFIALVDEREVESDNLFFVELENETYEINREKYGSIDYEPIYLLLAALSLSPIAIILIRNGFKLTRGKSEE